MGLTFPLDICYLPVNVQVYVTQPQYQLLVTVNKTMTETNNSLTSVIKYLSLAASDC